MSRGKSRPFRRAGEVGGKALGLTRRQADHLQLVGVWTHVAGPALARQVRVTDWLRGTLTLQTVDSHWAEAIRPLLPELLGRLAREVSPKIAIKRFRMRVPGEAEIVGDVDPNAASDRPHGSEGAANRVPPLRRRASRPIAAASTVTAADRERRLLELRDLYLKAAKTADPSRR